MGQSGAGQRRQQLQALTGLRVVAALLVVMFHFLTIHVPPGPGVGHAVARAAANVVASGFTGVSFFFILSGFILAYTYVGPAGHLKGTRWGFWRARIARIYPLYLLALVVAVGPYLGWGQWHEQFCVGHHALISGNQPLVTAIASTLMLGGWLPCLMTWNAPAWSLSAEAFFYLLFPLAIVGMARLDRRRLVVAAVVCWALTLAAALAFIALSLDRTAMHAAWWERYWTWLFYSNPLLRLPEFLIGVALGRLFLSRSAERCTGGWLRAAPTALSACAALAVVAVLCAGPFPLILFNQVVLDPLYALLIYALAFGEGPVAALFATPLLVLLGEASYGMYILHWPIRNWMGHLLPRLPVGAPPFLAPTTVYFLAYLCVVIGVSILSLRVVEHPARRAVNETLKNLPRSRLFGRSLTPGVVDMDGQRVEPPGAAGAA